jgi:hypothetical protein
VYIEVDVEDGPNCDWSLVKVFESKERPYEVTRVTASRPGASPQLWQVTGWSEGGPTPAYAAHVSDSGEGLVLLVYGGSHGIRLKPGDSVDLWDVADNAQWGEPCLLLAADAYAE